MEFFGLLVISGMMNGAIYGLVALGFVLIYKSSSVLNFSSVSSAFIMLLLGPCGENHASWTAAERSPTLVVKAMRACFVASSN